MIDRWKEEKTLYLRYLSDFCEYGGRDKEGYIKDLCLRHRAPLMVIKRGQEYHEEIDHDTGRLISLWTLYLSRSFVWVLSWLPKEEKWVVKGDPIYLKAFGWEGNEHIFEFTSQEFEEQYQGKKPIIFEYQERENLCTSDFIKDFFRLRYGYKFK